MTDNMINSVSSILKAELNNNCINYDKYEPDKIVKIPKWLISEV